MKGPQLDEEETARRDRKVRWCLRVSGQVVRQKSVPHPRVSQVTEPLTVGVQTEAGLDWGDGSAPQLGSDKHREERLGPEVSHSFQGSTWTGEGALQATTY